jgi:GT2 family glycosyltransferase
MTTQIRFDDTVTPLPRITLGPAVAALPVRDEEDEIEGCLRALGAQEGARLHAVVLCVNNTTDRTVARVDAIAPELPFAVHVLDVTLPPERARAGVARRIAMEHAAERAGPEGVLLTTDADGRVAPDWLKANLTALRTGADAVAGRAVIEPVGAKLIPAYLHELDARECAYAALLDEIASLIDPNPTDPWPRHDEHSGASIAVTVAAYRLAGGMPPVALGEDRAFFDALRRIDARIRHAPDAVVTVSARTVGRAAGGMADTMRSRIQALHSHLDDRLEPAVDSLRRTRLRAGLRAVWRSGTGTGRLPARLGMTPDTLAAALSERYFGAAWMKIEAQSPRLRRRLVPLHDLARQTACALRIRAVLTRPADRADTLPAAAAE